jgi:ribosomal protein L35AE/L33A
LFWQGVVEARFKENLKGKAREEFIQSLVGEILQKYPPESKK